MLFSPFFLFFFFNDTATTEIYTLSLHDALPISRWETYRTVAEQLTDANAGIYGAGLQTSWQENYYNFIWQNGGDLLDDTLTKSLVGEPPAAEAFTYLTEFFTSELTPSIAIQQSNPVADTLFPAGQVA